MNLFVRIADGRVVEILQAEVEGVLIADRFHPDFVAQLRGVPPEIEDQVALGWHLTEAGSLVAPPVPVPEVPQVISRRQARLALLGAGLLEPVETAVSACSAEIRITWQDATEWHRDDPVLAQLASALDLDAAAVDALFTAAATL